MILGWSDLQGGSNWSHFQCRSSTSLSIEVFYFALFVKPLSLEQINVGPATCETSHVYLQHNWNLDCCSQVVYFAKLIFKGNNYPGERERERESETGMDIRRRKRWLVETKIKNGRVIEKERKRARQRKRERQRRKRKKHWPRKREKEAEKEKDTHNEQTEGQEESRRGESFRAQFSFNRL